MFTCPLVPKESHCKWPQGPGQDGLAVVFFAVVPFSLPQHFPSTHEWNSVVVQVPTGPTVGAGTCVCPEWNSVVVQVPTKPRVHVHMSHCSQELHCEWPQGPGQASMGKPRGGGSKGGDPDPPLGVGPENTPP